MTIRPYYVDVPLRWSDMDALRHVNNVQFARLLEEARIAAFRDWFSDRSDTHRPRLLIARAEIDYLAQLHYRDEPIVIATWVTRVAGASFDLGYEIVESREPGAQVYATAETTQVQFDLETQRPQRISDDARAVLQRYAGDPVPMKRRPAGHR